MNTAEELIPQTSALTAFTQLGPAVTLYPAGCHGCQTAVNNVNRQPNTLNEDVTNFSEEKD